MAFHATLFTALVLLAVQPPELRIDELNARISIGEEGSRVLLPIDNDGHDEETASVEVELLDPSGAVASRGSRTLSLRPGRTEASVAITPSLGDLDPADRSQLLFYRIRYRVASSSAASAMAAVTGLFSVSQATPDLFELDIVHPEFARAGRPFRVIVVARHPATAERVSGVAIEARLNDGSRALGDASAISDLTGIAILDMTLDGQFAGRMTLSVRGSKGPTVLGREDSVDVYRLQNPLLTTDKTLYQPGQTLHMRLLALDASRHAIEGADATFRVLDDSRRLVFSDRARTSRFGIASIDWSIPETTGLGNYRVESELEGDEEGASLAVKDVRVTRYEVPEFVVEAATDKAFYLRGQKARVEVRARYLFGEPVVLGRGRVVRSENKGWDYRRGRWKSEGGEEWTGELDSSGSFAVTLDLGEDQKVLESNEWSRSRDVDFDAYVTDENTGRTEERRFEVRITKAPIHVYWIDGSQGPHLKAPFDFYLSTFSADGSPIECDVTVQVLGDDGRPGPVLASARTNRYGVAKVERFTMPAGTHASQWGGVEMLLTARDGRGMVASWPESVWTDDQRGIDVRLDHTIHRPGEAFVTHIEAPPELSRIALFVVRNDDVLGARVVSLKGGRVDETVPYDPSFRGALSVVAFALEEKRGIETGSHPLIYPSDDELRVKVEPDRQRYQPGDRAEIRFDVRRAGGTAVQSALGVTVVDRALLERERTDDEFGSYSTTYLWDWMGYGDSLGGISMRDVERLDPSREIPDGMDLVAEILFRYPGFYPDVSATERYWTDVARIFQTTIAAELDPVAKALERLYPDGAYPQSLDVLDADLAHVSMSTTDFPDPWDHPYHPRIFPEGRDVFLTLTSDGPDERAGTDDDFVCFRRCWNHFGRPGRALDRAMREHHLRTGGFIRDRKMMREDLLREGFDSEELRDPWGHKYRFDLGVDESHYFVRVYSGDVRVWESRIDYFAEPRVQIEALLDERLRETGTWPDSPKALERYLARNEALLRKERDPWGRRYVVTFTTDAVYADRMEIVGGRSTSPHGRTTITPVTRRLRTIHVRSDGPNGPKGPGAFEVAKFQRVVTGATETSYSAAVRPERAPSEDEGAIGGTITDAEGGVLPGVSVTATMGNRVWKTTTDEKGDYLIRDLLEGTYTIWFELAGFERLAFEEVPVRRGEKTSIDARLSVATLGETVTVTGESPAVDTKRTATISTDSTASSSGSRLASTRPIMTPRLRQYFPETLLWEPELVTDADGVGRIALPLADNVTTWNLSAIASNVDGEIGLAETDILSFQPFFIDLEPPAVLTVGDRIRQPILLRSYLAAPMDVEVGLEGQSWFRLASDGKRIESVPAGGSASSFFQLDVVEPAHEGRERVTAVSSEASDAVEKTLEIHPDGRESVVADTRILSENGARFSIAVPEETLPGSVRGELRIYPSLIAHVLESLDAVRQRPYGCTEQAISAAYPGLLLLRYQRDHGAAVPGLDGAQREVSLAYQTLVTRQNPGGGFSYWTRAYPDVALTAYAVRFLADVRAFVAVDTRIEAKARAWLASQQKEDGRWVASDPFGNPAWRDALVTAVVAGVLAGEGGTSVDRALEFLGDRLEGMDEPYLIAVFALALREAGRIERAQEAAARLRSLARTEGSGVYWALETNTPFYGWGLAGRLETTALATLALARLGRDATDEALVQRGLVFLLGNKDRFGGWYSTQATMRVVETLLELLPVNGASFEAGATTLDLVVNGNLVGAIPLPAANEVRGPIHRDLSPWLGKGKNEIFVRSGVGVSAAAAEIVSSYYKPWPEDGGDSAVSSDLKFSVRFSSLEARVGEDVEVRVEAERVGFRGYGMLLAEVGLPPGAEVERASLEEALGWRTGSYRYEVRPDRVVFYLWPKAGGASVSFRFRPRFAMRAKTAPSRLYDYYNPESEVVVAPATLLVRK
jgi:A-macroglobulin TED domain/MG2 domain/Carboxypeptidase regulatory-like domain/Alpha-2-macroglobulin family/A-macroglobulin receptor binding domain